MGVIIRIAALIMHSPFKSFSALLALLASGIGHAQQAPNLPSHCKPDEFAYLNANMSELRYPQYKTEEERRTKPIWVLRKTGKVLSICTDRPSEPFSSVAYRFGQIGNVEFERVAAKSSPFKVFERTDTPHTGEAVLFFSVGPYTYCVSEATGQGSGVSLTVIKGGREVASFFSGNDRETDYEAGLLDLSFSQKKSAVLKESLIN
ncbi:hypothetical protein [Aromatoleum toluclasticum]|uniref:hypothetical protein n=1 Tax=Aromatoleum toluclasticum TaxID=92003 RepID=UPI001D18B786|nr:hypothetical protein [Aromatoleum toluclasticum]